jgi:hypothetical protein
VGKRAGQIKTLPISFKRGKEDIKESFDMPARTIDNLGIDISTRYAEDQKNLDQKLVREPGSVSAQTQIDVTVPTFASELETLFEMRRRTQSWADFYAPQGYNEQKKRLFMHQIIPSLGSDDKHDMQLQRLNSYIFPINEEDEEKKEKRPQWELDSEKEEQEKEKKILLTLLNCISSLDKYLRDINSRRGQYHRG